MIQLKEISFKKKNHTHLRYYKNHKKTQMKSIKRFNNNLSLFQVRFTARFKLI